MLTRLGYFARETLVSLRRNLLMTVAGVLTVAVSLALFGGIMLLGRWVDHGTTSIKGGVRLEIFMTVDATSQQISDVQTALKSDSQVRSFTFVDQKAALAEFRRIFRKDPDLTRNVDASALPTSFRIVPTRAEGSCDRAKDRSGMRFLRACRFTPTYLTRTLRSTGTSYFMSQRRPVATRSWALACAQGATSATL